MRAAIRLKEQILTYDDLDRLVAKEKNPPSIFVADDPLQSIIYFLALWKQGKVACPLNARLPEKALEEQKRRLKNIPEGLATCLFTSGTTAAPKIAMHTLENHHASADQMIERLDLKPGDTYKLSLPLHHVAGIAAMIRTLRAGATLSLDDSWEGVTHLSLVPTQLLKNPPLPPSLKVLLLGGAPVPKSLIRDKVVVSYGMTEMSSTIATNGKKLPLAMVKISDKGEILVKGPTLFQGYLGQPLPFIDGWFPTRDKGEIIGDTLHFLGRLDRQFISGGENIQPEEIEMALLTLPGISAAKVEGVEDSTWGKVPSAQITSEISYTLEDIQERLSDLLPRYKLPKKLLNL